MRTALKSLQLPFAVSPFRQRGFASSGRCRLPRCPEACNPHSLRSSLPAAYFGFRPTRSLPSAALRLPYLPSSSGDATDALVTIPYSRSEVWHEGATPSSEGALRRTVQTSTGCRPVAGLASGANLGCLVVMKHIHRPCTSVPTCRFQSRRGIRGTWRQRKSGVFATHQTPNLI